MSCSCNQSPCCCGGSPCQPANTAFLATCPDPGMVNSGVHLSVLDVQFCERRLSNATAGFLVLRTNGNSQPSIQFTNAPEVALGTYQAVQGQPQPNFTIQGSDSILRELLAPVVANLFPRTNAAGQIIWDALPNATVPDPLTLANITVTTLATIAAGLFTGAVSFTGLGTGDLSSVLGLDASNNLIKGNPATTGVQVQNFFESPTSPSVATPNASATAGSLLTIGNLLFDSVGTAGGALFTATNSQTLTCLTAGTYEVEFGGEVTYTGGSSGQPGIILLVNGVAVNNGNGRSDASLTTTQRAANLWGKDARRYNVGDTIQLQLGASSGTNTHVYEARVVLTRTGN